MLTTRRVAVAVLVGVTTFGAGLASSQDYPNRPIRIITNPPGSGADREARLIAQAISVSLGQPVILENRGGGGGIITAQAVARAQPDGHTMLHTGASMWTGPLLQEVSYDSVKDFSPVSLVSSEPSVLTVHPALGVKSVKELIALAKAKPGQLNYSSTGTGGSSHISNELFKSMAGVNIVRVSYKSQTAALIDMLGGEGKTLHVGFWSIGPVEPHAKTGKVIVLAITSAEPSVLAPGLPTMAAAGVPGYEFTSINAIFVPAKTPAAIVNRLNHEIVRYLRSPEAKEKFLASGAEATGSTPKELAIAMQTNLVKVAKVIRDIKDAGGSAN